RAQRGADPDGSDGREALPHVPRRAGGSARTEDRMTNGAATRILFVVNNPAFFVSHRLVVGNGARDAGYEVHVATPAGPASANILAEGLRFHAIPMSRSGREPWRELWSIEALRRLYLQVRPAVVH